ncbi:hypothetical protein [Haloarcula argentinensis]|uniref:Uncharacterized protein n=1 Tax=Haloarcula argentinensis TaxID=43776 RepID=A0A847UPP4_HALAR|nr:hypothetical protein [Haloarcula argentinensis]NLV14090.1 hypothetical protein [Haloarcula argentinensis]
MQEIIQQLALVASQADESPEERTQRLKQVADDSGATARTLYEVEEDLRGLGWSALVDNEETVDQIEAKLQGFAPMFGLDPQRVEDQFGPETFIHLFSQYALARPEATAYAIATLDDVLTRRGLYDELDVDVPEPGEYSGSEGQ